jgi:ribulose-phosphate 3-epimerase
MPPIQIAPSLLAADLANAGRQMRAVQNAGCEMLHVDVMDGHFAPNLTFGPAFCASLDQACDLPMSTHLMVTDPEHFFEPFAKAGCDDLFFHIELDLDHAALCRRLRELGVRPGIAIEMETPPEKLAAVVGEAGILLVMTVRCGYTGQDLHPEPAQKIPELRRMFGPDVDIAVDGGVGVSNAGMLASRGANVFVAGKSIFWADDIPTAAEELRMAAQKGVAQSPSSHQRRRSR